MPPAPSIILQEIEALTIKGVDALHIACAEEQKADHFLTCDDKILKKYHCCPNVDF
jgi:predicted nucleic acid-binding protein